MLKKTGWVSAGLPLMALSTLASVSLGAGSASAEVICKTVGVPKGCIVRPGVAAEAVVVAPGVAAVGVGAPGVGVRAGEPLNRGGPVDRVGRR